MGNIFVDFRQLQDVRVFSYLIYFSFKSRVNDLVGLRPCMVVWSVPKLGTELLEFLGAVLGSPGTDYGLLLIHVL